ncbi:type I polyketide synthase, partial [Streptomyces sp. NPDC002513]
GFDYGPVFQGLRTVWRHGQDLFAEVALPEQEAGHSDDFGIHPALLDAALHPLLLAAPQPDQQGLPWTTTTGAQGLPLPFVWRGVSLHAVGATTLRVRLTPLADNEFAVTVADDTGTLVAHAQSLTLRAINSDQLHQATTTRRDPLLRVDWIALSVAGQPQAAPGGWTVVGSSDIPLDQEGVRYATVEELAAAVDGGAAVPDTVLLCVPDVPVDQFVGTGPAHEACVAGHGAVDIRAADVGSRVWAVAQTVRWWLDDERFEKAHLVVVTHGAVTTASGDPVRDLAGAGAWGLLRSVLTERPGCRVTLADVDGDTGCWKALREALGRGEPQLAVRSGAVLVPRLTRIGSGSTSSGGSTSDVTRLIDSQDGIDSSASAGSFGGGTVMITGGTGALGGMIARRLVTEHGVQAVLLVSRRGIDAPGAGHLVAELSGLGVRVTVAACDVADPDMLADVLTEVASDYPLTAVVHAAGILSDATLGSLTPTQLEQVLRPKLHAAVNLHNLTREMGLAQFMMFSSVAGVVGTSGQGAYAAANAMLDALASWRRARGLAGVSLAWGLWEQDSEMTAGLADTDRHRMARLGVVPLNSEQGLGWFDESLGRDEAVLVPAKLDTAALRHGQGPLPAVLRSLVPTGLRTAAAATADRTRGPELAQSLAGHTPKEQQRMLLELVRTHSAAVLGHTGAEEVSADRPFTEIGLDSLTALELRTRLAESSGLRLSATLIFDYPTPQALAGHLRSRLCGADLTPKDAILKDLGNVESLLAGLEAADRDQIAVRLREVSAKIASAGSSKGKASEAPKSFDSASDEELFNFIKSV